MRDNHSDMKMEEAIWASMKMTEVPDPELNSKLKTALYRQEAVLGKQPAMHKISLWYLPMVLNLSLIHISEPTRLLSSVRCV